MSVSGPKRNALVRFHACHASTQADRAASIGVGRGIGTRGGGRGRELGGRRLEPLVDRDDHVVGEVPEHGAPARGRVVVVAAARRAVASAIASTVAHDATARRR